MISHLGALAARGASAHPDQPLASTDVPLAHAAYARSRERLLSAGVEIHEVRADGTLEDFTQRRIRASLHAKAVVVDREHAPSVR